MKKANGRRMQKITNYVTALFLVSIVSVSFLSVIPVKGSHESSEGSPVHYTVIAEKYNETHSFEFLLTGLAEWDRSQFESAVARVANEIDLTEEQIATILEADRVIILSETDSYIEISNYLMLWFIPYGAFYHLYLSPIDAMNTETALVAATGLFAIFTVIFAPTLIGGVICGVIAYFLFVLELDYHTLYNDDHNADNSFDMWGSGTCYDYLHTTRIAETPNYVWWLTPAGAYIYYDKRVGPRSTPDVHAHGCRARLM